MIGEVSGLPAEPHVLGSGSKARVLEVQFPSGETAIVPRANVELIWELTGMRKTVVLGAGRD